MKARKRIFVILAATWLPITLALLPVQVGAAPLSCGLGSHWIDTCPPGMDVLASTAIVEIDLDFDGTTDQTLVLNGVTTIYRSGPLDDSMHFPGIAPINGHLEAIDAEIVAASLTGSGVTLTVGAGATPGGVVLAPTLGVILEQPGNASLADSFLNVRFELDLGGGSFVYNVVPVTVEAIDLTGVFPGGTSYDSGPVSLSLFGDSAAGPAAVLNWFALTIPEPGTVLLVAIGLCGLAIFRRQKV